MRARLTVAAKAQAERHAASDIISMRQRFPERARLERNGPKISDANEENAQADKKAGKEQNNKKPVVHGRLHTPHI